ncbi:MAG: hypothetical protein AB7O38_23470 [Pirellulaceae bacterium]
MGPVRFALSSRMFHVFWTFVILVSVLDGYLVAEYRHHLDELNPQGQVLIFLNGGQVWLLLVAKFFGTVTACAMLLMIHDQRPSIGTVVAAVLAGLQFTLLCFLMFA